MMIRSKRKSERPDDRPGGNVIPLPLARSDSGAPQEARAASTARPAGAVEGHDARASRSAEPLATASADVHHDDDHPDIKNFFAGGSKSAPPSGEHWSDLEGHDHDSSHHLGSHRRAMLSTLGIAAVGLLLIGLFLLYNKVLMPTPEELGSSQVALPTPEMMNGVPPPRVSNPGLGHLPGKNPPPGASAAPAAKAPPAAKAETSSPVADARVPAKYDEQLGAARKLGFRPAAEGAYLEAIALHPKGGEALSGLAMLYLNLGDNKRAKQRAEQALALDASNAEAWIVLGAAQSALGKRSEAREAYARCAALPGGKYVAECKRMLR